jgi:DNA modification methylase
VTPYYEHGGITIYHGDCRDVLPRIKADVIVTDPPYGVGKAEWDAEFPTAWIRPAFACAPRVLCMSGNAALAKAVAAFGWTYRDCIALYAVNGMTRSPIAFGNWFPAIAAGDWKWRAQPNVLKFTVNTRAEKIDHPSPKPLAAMRELVARYTEPDWMIADPFMGSGTTLLAASGLGRRAIGIEIEERYCEIAAKRLSQEVLPLGVTA